MWSFLGRLGLGPRPKNSSLDSVFEALGEGEASRPLPTLVCRTCGLKYPNTGTYLQGSPCPQCHPAG